MARSMFFSPVRLFSKLRISDGPLVSAEIKSEPEDSPVSISQVDYDETPQNGHKRKRISDETETALKKRLLSPERSATPERQATPAALSWLSPDHVVNPAGAALQRQSELDRSLMPPPPKPRMWNTHRGKYEDQPNGFEPSREDDDVSLASTSATKRRADEAEEGEEMRMEAARRYAAAVTLPDSSGMWSEVERDLFFHIAYRGFEPLIPAHWSEFEFGSFPLNLFAPADSTDPPLLRNIRGHESAGSRALAMLVQAGDRVGGNRETQRILQRYTLQYLKWALKDVGIRSEEIPGYIPVHVWITRRKGDTTLQTLERMAKHLHRLSEKHQNRLSLRPSTEPADIDPDNDTTRVIDATSDSTTSLPTLFGIVLISSVISVVTLNPYQLQQPTLEAQLQSSAMSESDGAQSTSYLDRTRLRIIAELDFSRKEMNIWNALGFAIVCMSVRKEAVRTTFGEGEEGLEKCWQAGREWELNQPDPDA